MNQNNISLENVVNGLECCLSASLGETTCPTCTYRYDENGVETGGCEINLLKDAIALLKAQEPIEPVFERQFMSCINIYDCGKCGTSLGAKGIAKYCMACGRPVKWE